MFYYELDKGTPFRFRAAREDVCYKLEDNKYTVLSSDLYPEAEGKIYGQVSNLRVERLGQKIKTIILG